MGELESRETAHLVCITDSQHHVRKFLRETLGHFRFTIYECVEARELGAALDASPPDLVVLGMTAGGIDAGEMLRTLAAKDFAGKVLPFAQRNSAVLEPIQDLAGRLGISLLPPLLMPFSETRLRESVAILLSQESTGSLGGHGRSRAWGMARALVSAKDRYPLRRHARRRGAAAHSASRLGNRSLQPISFRATAILGSRCFLTR